ncbi:BET1 homolog isoform X1 [Hydra vulgaris]|nr:BET1 homolog [Hydra vulgaris]
MRRAGQVPVSHHGYEMVEEENNKILASLTSKVQELKSLSIDIGHEVKYQNKMLNEMNTDFDSLGSFLQGTMGRLASLTKKGHHKLLCYVLLFCFCVMLFAWFVVRFR